MKKIHFFPPNKTNKQTNKQIRSWWPLETTFLKLGKTLADFGV
jgi:hypothetical protein